ncbi:MAG: type II secretion system F family protein [Candidatus Binataceae bacterium]
MPVAILPAATVILVAAAALALYPVLFGRGKGGRPRLPVWTGKAGPTSPATGPQGRITAKLGTLVEWQIRRLRRPQPSSLGGSEIREIQKKLAEGGFRGVMPVAVFTLVRGGMVLAGAGVGFLAGVRAGGAPVLIYSGAGAILGFLIPTFLVLHFAGTRQRRITAELPDVLALLVVSLEAGIGITDVIRLVGRETAKQGRLLGRELSDTASQMAAGVTLEESLRNLGDRTGVDELKSIAALLIQSEKIGARLGPALRASADLLNSRRRLAAEEAAQKTAIKILFPLVLLILPAMLLIILGPAILQLSKTFTP